MYSTVESVRTVRIQDRAVAYSHLTETGGTMLRCCNLGTDSRALGLIDPSTHSLDSRPAVAAHTRVDS